MKRVMVPIHMKLGSTWRRENHKYNSTQNEVTHANMNKEWAMETQNIE